MMNKSYQFLIVFLLILSCSSIDIVDINKETAASKVNITCPVKNYDIEVYSENKKLNEQFTQYIKETNLSFIDQYFLWSLYQLASRPDATTLNSKTLTFIKYRGKEYFLITTPKSINSSSFIESLNLIGKHYKVKKSLASYARKLKDVKFNVPISSSLQSFIERNKVALYKNKSLRKYTFKGNQIAREGETILAPDLEHIISTARKLPKDIFKTNYMFDANEKYRCNFDKNLFTSSPIIQRRTNEIKSNFYGIFKDKDNFFLSLTSSLPVLEQFDKRYFVVRSLPISSFNAAICISNDDNEMILAKNLVHSEQLLNNLLISIKSRPTPAEIINKKRYINLLYPERTIVEIYGNEIGINQNQTNYFVPTLGKIDIIKRENNFRLYKEPRTGILKCN